MARYNEVDQRIWNSRDFRELSNRGKLLWLFLLTGPHNTGLPAIYRIGTGYIMDEMKWDADDIVKAMGELTQRKMVTVHKDVNVIYLPNWYKYSAKPKQARVLKSWLRQLDNIPQCKSKNDYVKKLTLFLEDTEYGGDTIVSAWNRGKEIVLKPTYIKKKSAPKKKSDKPSSTVEDMYVRLSEDFHKKAKKTFPKAKHLNGNFETTVLNGAVELDKLVRLDGYDIETVEKVLMWAVGDDFWSKNCQSLSGIRRTSKNGLMKFENMLAKMPTGGAKSHGKDAMKKFRSKYAEVI